jgi:cytochrome c-type biogenesis protein CcmH/NrfG
MLEFILGITGLVMVSVGIIVIPLWRNHAWKMGTFILISFPLFIAGCYYLWGASPDNLKNWLHQGQEQLVLRQQLQSIGGKEGMIQRLNVALQKEPNQPQGWYLLGKLYYANGEYAKAIESFAQANHFQANNPKYLYAYAQALFLAGSNSNLEQSNLIIQQILTIKPNDVDAINMQGLIAYAQGNYPQAIASWQKALSLLPEDDPRRADFIEALARVPKVVKANSGEPNT